MTHIVKFNTIWVMRSSYAFWEMFLAFGVAGAGSAADFSGDVQASIIAEAEIGVDHFE